MKKLILAAMTALALMAAPVMAQPVLNICTGGESGNYYKTALELREQVKGQVAVNVIATNGSLDNFDRLNSGACDAAIVQSDAHGIFVNRNPSARLSIHPVAALYTEYVHLVCNVNAKVNSVKDLNRSDIVLLTGPNGSGTSLTWETWVGHNESYAKVRTAPEGGQLALDKIEFGTEAQCMLFVAGLKSGTMNEVNEFGKGKLQLVSVDDGSFDDVLDPAKNRVYAFKDIPSGTYPNLQNSGWFGTGNNVPTLTLGAMLVIKSDWIDANSKGYENFGKAAKRWALQYGGK